MTQSTLYNQGWKAVPKNDRLKQWCVVNAADPGRGKQVVADNIRSEGHAKAIAATPELLEAVKASRAILTSILGTDVENRIIAEQVTIIDAAVAKAELSA